MTQRLVELTIDSIPIGQPLEFALRGGDGALLANKGYTIRSRSELDRLIQRGVGLRVDIDESAVAHRAYLSRLNQMIDEDRNIVDIANTKVMIGGETYEFKPPMANGWPDWIAYQSRLDALLRTPSRGLFIIRLNQLQHELQYFLTKMPDPMLLALVYLSYDEIRRYSSMHSLLVWAIATLTARQVLKWDESTIESLGLAALTMNISMIEMQDKMAMQASSLSNYQEEIIEKHAELSRSMLLELGVPDPLWLDAVEYHRDNIPGPLSKKTMGQQMGRLLQRADVMAARLAPRATRQGLTVTAAMQAGYLDESKQPDEAGSAIVMTLGIYAPGAYVQLASKEIGIVVRRVMVRPGVMGKSPVCALILNKDGYPVTTLHERDTSMPAYKIIQAVSAKSVNVNTPLSKLLTISGRK